MPSRKLFDDTDERLRTLVWKRSWYVCRNDNGYLTHLHHLKTVEFLAVSFQEHSWYTFWVTAIYQVRFPRYRIDVRTVSRDLSVTETTEQLLKKKISAAQAQVTKVLHAIRNFEEKEKHTLFGVDPNHPQLLHAYKKLNEKQINLENLQKQLI